MDGDIGEAPDLYRDSWLRYLGYANEVGEAFRALVPRAVVRASYSVAFGYTLADTVDKSWKMYKKDGRPRKVLIEAGDALVWQTLASVIIPGFTINRICAYSQRYLARYSCKLPGVVRSLITAGVGLASIPIIVHPIDHGTTLLMDCTYRKWVEENTLLVAARAA